MTRGVQVPWVPAVASWVVASFVTAPGVTLAAGSSATGA